MKKSTFSAILSFLSFFAPAQVNYWSTTGNGNTNPAINFIGTTDSTPVRFRANNNWAGEINQFSFNTSFGYVALSSVKPIQTTRLGLCNSVFGALALRANEKGSANTAVGFQALESFGTGNNNTAVGVNALVYIDSSNDNTAIGVSSLYSTKKADGNTAVGVNSLFNNRVGENNVAVGALALDLDSNGSGNTSVGYESQLMDSIGFNNTAVGYQCLMHNKTGTFLTTMGNSSDVAADGLTNASAFGNGALVDGSNKVVIGNTAVTVIGGIAPWSNFSDERFKYNIRNNVPGLQFIKGLKAVTYQINGDKLDTFLKTGVFKGTDIHTSSPNIRSQLHTGLLAQQVEKVCREIGYDFDGVIKPAGKNGTYSLAYSQFVVPLIQAVQEQQNMIEKLEKENNNLNDALNKIMLRLEKLEQKK